MIDDAELRWVKGLSLAPRQDRSKRTLERLLDAAEEILRAGGPAALTVPAVAQAARSSVGSFYARFPDKSALLRTLHERACEQSIATTAAALDPARWQGVATPDLVRGFVSFAVRLFAERRPMMLAFSAELASDPGFAERRAHTAAAIARALARLLLDPQRRAAIGHPDPERAVAMSLRLVTGVLEQRTGLEAGGLSRWGRERPQTPASCGGLAEVAIDDDALAVELTRAVVGYLNVA